MYAKLVSNKSKYAVLYRGKFPNEKDAPSIWRKKMGDEQEYVCVDNPPNRMTYLESIAVVNWVYRTLKNTNDRKEFTQELLRHVKELHSIQNTVRFSRGVVYNAAKVELHFLSSISSINRNIREYYRMRQSSFGYDSVEADIQHFYAKARDLSWYLDEERQQAKIEMRATGNNNPNKISLKKGKSIKSYSLSELYFLECWVCGNLTLLDYMIKNKNIMQVAGDKR